MKKLILTIIIFCFLANFAQADTPVFGKEFSVVLPSCTLMAGMGVACYNTTDKQLYIGDGSTAVAFGGGGSMVYPDAGVPLSTGVAWGTSYSTDGTGDCGASAICLGGHTHSGYGDIVGPASSTDNAIARFDLATGKLLQNSDALLDDSENMTLPAVKTSIFTFNEANINEDDVTWTMTGTGPLVHVTGNTTTVTMTASEAIDATTPLTYKITITGTGAGGTATYTFGGVTGTTIAASGAIAIVDYITASTTGSMIITPDSACTVSISSITIEKLSNNTGDLTVEGNLKLGSPIQNIKGQDVITLGPTGNVGIGTTAPNYKLEVIGETRVSGNAYFDAATFIKDINGTVNSWWGWYAWDKEFQFNTRTSANVFVQNIFTANWDTGNFIMVPTAGNVGIGLIAPQSKFDTLGAMRVTDVYTNASNYESYTIDAGVTTADTLTIAGVSAGTGAANLNIAITPKGTGAIILGKTAMSNSAVTCATGAACTDVPALYAIYLTTDGSNTMTLADGTNAGQEKYISHKTDGGQVTITPTNFSGGTNVVLTAAGDNVKFHWNGTKWDIQSTFRGTIN